MAEMNPREMNIAVQRRIDSVVGLICCRQHIGEDRSLFLGFGEVIRVKTVISEADHGKWEIGTYHGSWRIVRGQQILCGSNDSVESVDELRRTIQEIEWGKCSAIRQLTAFDVRVEFDNGILVDILGTISDEDELLHIFFPDKNVVAFSIAGGWVAGKSEEPWT